MRKWHTWIAAFAIGVMTTACGTDLVDMREQINALNAVQNGALMVDVRTPEEVAQGSFDGAINVPHGEIVAGLAALGVDKKRPIVVFCHSGNRSEKAANALEAAGYSLVIDGGGYSELRAVEHALLTQRDSASSDNT